MIPKLEFTYFKNPEELTEWVNNSWLIKVVAITSDNFGYQYLYYYAN